MRGVEDKELDFVGGALVSPGLSQGFTDVHAGLGIRGIGKDLAGDTLERAGCSPGAGKQFACSQLCHAFCYPGLIGRLGYDKQRYAVVECFTDAIHTAMADENVRTL